MTPEKLYLPGRPANEGARRLAWLLLDFDAGARKLLNERGINDLRIERMVRGEILPDMQDGRSIFFVSDHAIAAWHWNHAPMAAWGDRPQDWPSFRSLRVAA